MRPIPTPKPTFTKTVASLKGLGDHLANIKMLGMGQNPGSVPMGDHNGFSINSCEFTLDPHAFDAGQDKPKWLNRGYGIYNALVDGSIARGLDYIKTVMEHAYYWNCFGTNTFQNGLIELIGAQAIQLVAYNTNPDDAQQKNDRVGEVGKAFYDAHVHDKGLITIKNYVISECGLPIGGGRASYALSCFPAESDVLIDNVSISCLHAPGYQYNGKTYYSRGALHISAKTNYLYYLPTPNPYTSPRTATLKDVQINYRSPDRPIVQIMDLAAPLLIDHGEFIGHKIEIGGCKGPIEISGATGTAFIEVDGVNVGMISKGYKRAAIMP